MKKITLFLCVELLFVAPMLAQFMAKTRSDYDLKGDVKWCKEYDYIMEMAFGEWKESDEIFFWSYDFSKDGKLTSYVDGGSQRKEKRFDYEYNEDGILAKEIYYDDVEDKERENTYCYYYNKNKQLSKIEAKNEYGGLMKKTKRTYLDSITYKDIIYESRYSDGRTEIYKNGLLISSSDNGESHHFTYDNQNRLIQEKFKGIECDEYIRLRVWKKYKKANTFSIGHVPEKKVDYTKKYFYNDKGLVSKTITTGIRFTVGTAFYTYKYDDHGNWIQRIITIGNKKFYRGRLILYY